MQIQNTQSQEHMIQEIRSKYETLPDGRRQDLQRLIDEAEAVRSEISDGGEGGGLPEAEIETFITSAELEFPQKALALRQADLAEKSFSKTHNLIAKSVKPSAAVTALLISLSTFLDAAINSAFFYNAHMVAGPTAALLISFLFSLGVATPSAFAGFFIGRYLNFGRQSLDAHDIEFKSVRIRARALFALYFAAMVFVIVTIGLVRSTESLDQVAHSFMTYRALFLNPEAVLLMIMNSCIAVFAFHKGRNGFSHPYGGYSEYQHGVTAAREALHESFDYYAETIEEYCKAAEEDATAGAKHQRKAIAKYNALVKKCQQAARRYESYIGDVKANFATEIGRLAATQSVISGQPESVPAAALEGCRFDDLYKPELPKHYRPPKGSSQNKASLERFKAGALKRLSERFESAIQP